MPQLTSASKSSLCVATHTGLVYILMDKKNDICFEILFHIGEKPDLAKVYDFEEPLPSFTNENLILDINLKNDQLVVSFALGSL